VPLAKFKTFTKSTVEKILTRASCGCQILYDPKTKVVKSTSETKKYDYYHCSDGRQVHREAGERQVNVPEAHLLNEFAQPV
jgi:hypothetical protein